MTIFRQLTGNICVVAPVLSWVISQLCKFVLTALGTGKLERERLWGSGGMPSAHAATVSALAVTIGRTYGVDNGEFALAAIFALVVMYDACGVRLEAGRHAKRLNEISRVLNLPLLFPTSEEKPQIHPEQGPCLEYADEVPAKEEHSSKKHTNDTEHPFHEQVGHTLPQVVVGALLGILVATIMINVEHI